MSDLGSWEWAQRTNGRLGRADQAELLRQGVLAQLSRLPAAVRRRVIRDADPLTLPSPPDTALAREAEDRVRELSKPPLYGHCLRTWAFAALFARRDRADHDEELLYLACVLHDLGLTEAHDGRDPSAACFAVEGARAAHTLLCDRQAPEDRARTVAEAISLHLNISVPERYGPEAVLLSKGVMVDVVGRRVELLPSESVSDVVARWPREGSGDLLLADTARQAKIRPQSRAALLHRLGFTKLVSANPLDHPR
jgi:HD domain